MEYIILDLEWNQPWPGSPSAKKVLPSPIRGEIVQIERRRRGGRHAFGTGGIGRASRLGRTAEGGG